jgi:hypothetical protein
MKTNAKLKFESLEIIKKDILKRIRVDYDRKIIMKHQKLKKKLNTKNPSKI